MTNTICCEQDATGTVSSVAYFAADFSEFFPLKCGLFVQSAGLVSGRELGRKEGSPATIRVKLETEINNRMSTKNLTAQ